MTVLAIARRGGLLALLTFLTVGVSRGQVYGDYVIEVPVELSGLSTWIADVTIDCVIVTEHDLISSGDGPPIRFDEYEDPQGLPSDDNLIGVGNLRRDDSRAYPIFVYSTSELGRAWTRIAKPSLAAQYDYVFDDSGPGLAFSGTVEVGVPLGENVAGQEGVLEQVLAAGYLPTHYLCDMWMRASEPSSIGGYELCHQGGRNFDACQPAIGSEFVRQVYGRLGQ